MTRPCFLGRTAISSGSSDTRGSATNGVAASSLDIIRPAGVEISMSAIAVRAPEARTVASATGNRWGPSVTPVSEMGCHGPSSSWGPASLSMTARSRTSPDSLSPGASGRLADAVRLGAARRTLVFTGCNRAGGAAGTRRSANSARRSMTGSGRLAANVTRVRPNGIGGRSTWRTISSSEPPVIARAAASGSRVRTTWTITAAGSARSIRSCPAGTSAGGRSLQAGVVATTSVANRALQPHG